MDKAIIATFYKTLKQAHKALKEKNRLFKNSFVIIKSSQGYFVVSKRQLV